MFVKHEGQLLRMEAIYLKLIYVGKTYFGVGIDQQQNQQQQN